MLARDVRVVLEGALERKLQTAQALVQKAGLDCEAQAKQNAPVDTGFLRNSIQYEQTGPGSCRVSVGADYGAYVELGTSQMAAQPYLFPAYTAVSKQLMRALQALKE